MNFRPMLLMGVLAAFAGAAQAATYTPLSLVEDPLIWGIQGNLPSQACALSGNGQVTAFHSAASQLAPSDRNASFDVFVQLGGNLVRSSRRVSGAESRDDSERVALSNTGRYMAFISRDDLLETGGAVSQAAYWLDRQTQTLKLVSRNFSGGSALANQVAISGDGRYVVFDSIGSNIVAPDLNNAVDVFRFDTQNETTQLVSSTATGAFGNSSSTTPSVDDSGTLIAFESIATNLIAGDDAVRDVFVKNMSTGAIVRASRNSSGAGGNQASSKAHIAGNGNFVVFESAASNLDLAMPKGAGITDIYRHNLSTGITELVSIGISGAAAQGASSDASVSLNGRFVWFKSRASNLVVPAPAVIGQLFRRDMNGTNVIQASNSPEQIFLPRSSDDGQSACFQTNGAVESADTNGHSDIYLVDVSNGVLVRQSVADNVIPSPYGTLDTVLGDVSNGLGKIVGNTRSRDLDAQAIDNQVVPQLIEITPVSGLIRLLGRNGLGELPDGIGAAIHVSGNGQWAVFETDAGNLVPGDDNGLPDTYRMNLDTGDLTLISRDSIGLATGSSGSTQNGKARISETGSRVLFRSAASNLVANDSNGVVDAFLWEQGNPIRRVSISSTGPGGGTQANDSTDSISMDATGTVLAFSSRASNLVAGDTNATLDVFMHNATSGQTMRVSRTDGGAQLASNSDSPAVSTDGRYVAYLVRTTSLPTSIALYDRIAASQVQLLPPPGVSIVSDTVQFGRDPRYLSYVGVQASEEIAFRFDRFAPNPNFELARIGPDEFGELYVADVRLASATQAVIDTNQPLAASDRNRASDLLLVTLTPGAVSFPVATISIPESAGIIDVPVRRLNGSDGFVTAGGSVIAGTAGDADFVVTQPSLAWESGDGGVQNLRLQILDDTASEGDETIVLQLQTPGGGVVVGSPATLQITVTDNDGPDPLFANGFE